MEMNGVDITSLTHAQIVSLATSSRVLRLHIKPFELPERQDEARDSVYASGRSSHETTPTPTNHHHFNDCQSPGAVMVTPNIENKPLSQKSSPEDRPTTPRNRRSPEQVLPVSHSPEPVKLAEPRKPEDRKDRRQRKKKSETDGKKKTKKGDKSEGSRTSSSDRKKSKDESSKKEEAKEVYPESVEIENEERVEIRLPEKAEKKRKPSVADEPERDVEPKPDMQRRRSQISDPKFKKEVSGDSAVLDEINKRQDDTDYSETEMPDIELATAVTIDPPEPKESQFIEQRKMSIKEEPTREHVDERISPQKGNSVEETIEVIVSHRVKSVPTTPEHKSEEHNPPTTSERIPSPEKVPSPAKPPDRVATPPKSPSPHKLPSPEKPPSPASPPPSRRRSTVITKEPSPEAPHPPTSPVVYKPQPILASSPTTPTDAKANTRSTQELSPEDDRLQSEIEEWERPSMTKPLQQGFKPITPGSERTDASVGSEPSERRETSRSSSKSQRQTAETSRTGYASTRSDFTDSQDQYTTEYESTPARKRLGSVSSQTTMSTTASTQTDDLPYVAREMYPSRDPVILRERPVHPLYPGPIDVYEVVRVGDDERRLVLQDHRPYLTRAESDMLLSRRLPAPPDARARAQSTANLQDSRYDTQIRDYYDRPIYLIRERPPPRPDYYPYLYPESEWTRSMRDLVYENDYWPDERFISMDLDDRGYPRRYPRYPEYPEPRYPRYPRYQDYMDSEESRPGTSADFSPIRKPAKDTERLRYMSKSADQGLNQSGFYKSRPRTTPTLNKMNSLDDSDPCYSTQSDRPYPDSRVPPTDRYAERTVPELDPRYGSTPHPERYPERPISQPEVDRLPDRPVPHPDLDRVRGLANQRQSPSIPDTDTNSSREQISGFREQLPQYRDMPFRDPSYQGYREPGFREPPYREHAPGPAYREAYRSPGYTGRQSDPFPLRDDRLPGREGDYPRDAREYGSQRPAFSREEVRETIDERLSERPDYREAMYRPSTGEPPYTPRRRPPHHPDHHPLSQSLPRGMALYDYERYHTASDRDLRDLDPYSCLAEHTETYLTASLRGSRADLSSASLRGSKADLSQNPDPPEYPAKSDPDKTPVINNQFPFTESDKQDIQAQFHFTDPDMKSPRSEMREFGVRSQPYNPRHDGGHSPRDAVMMEACHTGVETTLATEPTENSHPDMSYSVTNNTSQLDDSVNIAGSDDEEWDVEASC